MSTLDIIKSLCEKNNTSIKSLEKELGYSNGSLAKAKVIPSDRILEISKRFHVSMEYLMTGNEQTENQAEMENISPFVAKDESERRILMLCRKAGDVPKEEKEAIVNQFESTIDMYLKAKGIKGE